LGNLLMLVLDSEIISTPQSQVPWLHEKLSDLPPNTRFTSALYHAPFYPGVYANEFSDHVREAWGPVFD
jgi:hypothetical protein